MCMKCSPNLRFEGWLAGGHLTASPSNSGPGEKGGPVGAAGEAEGVEVSFRGDGEVMDENVDTLSCTELVPGMGFLTLAKSPWAQGVMKTTFSGGAASSYQSSGGSEQGWKISGTCVFAGESRTRTREVLKRSTVPRSERSSERGAPQPEDLAGQVLKLHKPQDPASPVVRDHLSSCHPPPPHSAPPTRFPAWWLQGRMNITNNTNNTTGKGPEFLDSQFRYTAFTIFYSLVFILGLTSNCYALYILRNIREAKAINEIRIYMTNLTIADLLFVLALVFWIDYYKRGGNWRFGEALCRIAGSMFFINTYCSILFLSVISFNRYWVVTRPLDAASSDHRRRGILVSATIWLCVLSASIFYLSDQSLNEDGDVLRCFEGYYENTISKKNMLVVTHFLIIGFFFLVFLFVVVCNVMIAYTLMSSSASPHITQGSARSMGLKRRALGMVTVVLGVFVICFLPHHVVQGPWTLAVLGLKIHEPSIKQSLNDAHQVTLMLMGLNCLLDPVIYCFATRMFRGYISAHVQKVRKRPPCRSNTMCSSISMESRQRNSTQGGKEDKLMGRM
ncbi:platelet-activating factor receptor [Arapaima gigas]